jgi:haloalkane dehalogenase
VLGSGAILKPAAASQAPQGAPGRPVARTPDERFVDLADYPFKPHYVTIDAGDGSKLRLHYVDERPSEPAKASGETVLLLHGNPTWSYLYRHVIPPLVAAGHRCIAVDLVGMGKSDKPTDRFVYNYRNHLDWLREAVFDRLDLRDVTMVCHDWGGLLGLLLLAEYPKRFRRVVASNTSGPREGGSDLGPGWEYLAKFLQFTQRTEHFQPSQVVENFTITDISSRVGAAYDAPYPGDAFLHGVRRWPLLIPITAEDEANAMITQAWSKLETIDVPFLCVFSDQDHVTHGNYTHLSSRIPGAKDQPHVVIQGAAHFVQEDKAPEFTRAVLNFIKTAR